MNEIKLPPTTFEIRNLRDVTNGPIFETLARIEQVKVLLNLIDTYCGDPSTCSQFDVEVLCSLTRSLLFEMDDILLATGDYLDSVACVDS